MNWDVIETEIEKNTGNISLCRSYISVDSTKVIHFSKRIVTKISSESKCFKVFVGLDENLDYIIKMKFLKEHESNTIRLAFQKRKEHVSAKACSVKLVQSYIEKMFDDKRHCRADFIDDENLIVISKNKKDFDVSNVVWKEFVDPDANKRMVSDKFVSFGQKKIIISKSLFDAAETEYKYLQFLKGTVDRRKQKLSGDKRGQGKKRRFIVLRLQICKRYKHNKQDLWKDFVQQEKEKGSDCLDWKRHV